MVSVNTVKVQPITCHEGRRGVQVQLYSFFNLSRYLTPCTSHFTPRNEPVVTTQEAGWVPGPVWMGVENLAPYQDSILY